MASVWRSVFKMFSGGAGRSKGLQGSEPSVYGNKSAMPVTVDSALQLSAVWGCVKLIAETVGSLPINVYKVGKDGELIPHPDHRLSTLFRTKINKWQTRQEFMESLMYQFAMLGNCYATVRRNTNGDITSMVPLMSQQMEVKLLDNGDISYQYTEDSGVRVFSQKSIWHNKLFGNGVIGLSPLGYARNSVGVGQAAELATTKIYNNGGKPSGILMLDKILTPEQRDKLKQQFSELATGNDDRLFIMEAGMKYEQVSLSPQDIELLSSRRFQIEDICRFFSVPSILVNDNHDNTAWGSGISQIIQGFYKFGLKPYITRLQSSMEANLLKTEERGQVVIRFDTTELLRPDYTERLKSAKEGVTGGILAANEYRKTEGLPPLPGGDKLYMQQQMVPVEDLDKISRGISKKTEE
jgi:HK97 family phage portal protein